MKRINQLNERVKGFYEQIRTSYHFKYVEMAVKSVNEQSKKFEEMLRTYHQRYSVAFGNKVDILVSIKNTYKNNYALQSRNAKMNRNSDGSIEERISQQSRESNDFTMQDESSRKLRFVYFTMISFTW